MLRCSTLGAIVGAYPGLGGAVVDWFAYGHTVSTSKDKSKFGNGDVRGVIGPESANTAKEGEPDTHFVIWNTRVWHNDFVTIST